MSFHILMTCKLILLTTDFRLAYLTTTWYIHFRCLIVISNCYVKNGRPGASLVVQWLRSQLYNGGIKSSPPDISLAKSHMSIHYVLTEVLHWLQWLRYSTKNVGYKSNQAFGCNFQFTGQKRIEKQVEWGQKEKIRQIQKAKYEWKC